MRFAIAMLVCTVWAVPAKCQQGRPAKADYSLSREAKKAELVMAVLTPQVDARGRQATGNGKQEAKHGADRWQDWLGWLNGFSTLVIAVFTILVATFIGRQVKTTRSLERAWLTGSPRFKNFEGPPAPGESLIYACSLKNLGKTPARILETGLAIRKAESSAVIPLEPRYKDTEQSPLNGPLVAPNDSFIITTTSADFTPEDYAALKNAKLVLYAYGYVKYKDVFGSYRETRFCHYYRTPGTRELQTEGFQLCMEAPRNYNRAT